ncbi:multisubunit Na+/H+ antiporter, MnhB subunit [Neorickettsia risticii str. Illinois]|uniref:Multisubunit Na+/H+ antiporter, MnhB subunit n=1 Tax=Neorickettsia risticii (strain Illinois) TaxID=434131 RepID=C6V3R4_NEORI|nr:Na(+)/H(+) antiporter subunit B [Neorickettsia risticii]ACT69031.1 multisubunit Na+/H+ antiporter, MnhB subunit [Neorickettsia risticii str. Illinois]
MIGDKVLKVLASGIIPLIILFAVYIQVHGEISPGGGFQAGVLLAASLITYSLVFGLDSLLHFLGPKTLIRQGAAGALIYLSTGLAPLLQNASFLQHSHIIKSLPLLSQEIGIFVLELGVGLTVFSSIFTIYMCFSLLLAKKTLNAD